MRNNGVIGVSGGADSLCLLHKMHSEGREFVVAHFNHNLRPTSKADAEFVQDFCEQLGIECVVDEGNVAQFSAERKISIELAGRLMRYSFFADLGDTVYTAHNANDNAESIIMHLLRGSGSGGLCGIAPEMDMHLEDGRVIRLIRPLIKTTRSEIEQYCREHGIQPLHDETNNDTKYFRNKIRHEIMPVLYENSSVEAINRAGEILREENDYFEKVIAEFPADIETKWFTPLPLAIKRRILLKRTKALTAATVSLERIDSCIEMAEKGYGGKIIELPDGIKVTLVKGELRICKS